MTGTEASASIPVSPQTQSQTTTPVQGWTVPEVPAALQDVSDRPQRLYNLGTPPDLIRLLNAREAVLENRPWWIHDVASPVLALPKSPRWNEAISTALLGDWTDPLTQKRELTSQAISALRAEARTIHRQLVPIWRRRTRHGRVLSLDADLGDGYCLHDLLAAQPGVPAELIHSTVDDQRLGALLRALSPLERHVVLARAAREGTTWTEAAMVTRADDPKAFGDRVRRKVTRLITEQNRRRRQSNNQWLPGHGQKGSS
ncbi:hypothetical protein [Streptomyces mirabilis]|uniref:hypothetical protein n=1 Tax=Streptomyces mirabilis TaxID=68239 RepID=UPI00225AF788|nr:hypothetical protein [Streptomyces mirabilis]MCX4429610.1 hypothetical protein [Streptomyces mirabilis]